MTPRHSRAKHRRLNKLCPFCDALVAPQRLPWKSSSTMKKGSNVSQEQLCRRKLTERRAFSFSTLGIDVGYDFSRHDTIVRSFKKPFVALKTGSTAPPCTQGG